jgi:hypothetical protein
MKPNKPVFCLPEAKFNVGDCVVYSDDIYDEIPYVQTYRDWGRVVITGSIFVPLVRPHEHLSSGWWYSGVIFDAPDEAMIGHNCGAGEMIHESEIRASSKIPSVGFLAFLGLLWLPTEDAANALGLSSRSLTRRRKKLNNGIHYLESNKSYIWNVGQVARELKINILAPEIERSNRGREVRSLDYPEVRYGPFKGVFSVPTPQAASIIVPSMDNTPPLCG